MELPLIEKYRPSSLEEVLLDERLKEQLRSEGNSYFVFSGRAGHGKCFGRNTPFLSVGECGEVRVVYVQEVVEGTLLVSPTGRGVRVQSVTSGKGALYRVVLPHGSFVVNEHHLLSLQCPRTQRICTFTLQSAPRDWLFYTGVVRGTVVPFSSPHVAFVLGAWLSNNVEDEREESALDKLSEDDVEEVAKYIAHHKLYAHRYVPADVFEWKLEYRRELIRGCTNVRLLPPRLLHSTLYCTLPYRIVPIGEGEYYGFEVEGHLVQLHDSVVVHNTTTALCLAKHLHANANANNANSLRSFEELDSIKEHKSDDRDATLELNASDDRGYDALHDKLMGFCRKKVRGRKVVILDECDNLTSKSQMFVAQLMEKYIGGNVTMILTCNNHYKLHADIINKVVLIDFDKIPLEHVVRHLEKVCTKEGVRYEVDALREVVLYCDFDIRRSLNMVEALGFGMDGVTAAAFVEFTQNRQLAELVREWMTADVERSVALLSNIHTFGFSNKDMIEYTKKWMETDEECDEEERMRRLVALHDILPHMQENDKADVVLFTMLKKKLHATSQTLSRSSTP